MNNYFGPRGGRASGLARLLSGLLLIGNLAEPATAAVFTVTTINNSGTGSLRNAINNANNATGLDTITFAIPGAGPFRILLASPLPKITSPVIIDGYTQSGASPNTTATGDNAVILIELNGAQADASDSALHIAANGCTVRGLAINRFAGGGIFIDNASSNVVEGNFVGLDVAGKISYGNSPQLANIFLLNAGGNLIGGPTVNARNLIAGNLRAGVEISGFNSSGNRVAGNFIGPDRSGASVSNSPGIGVIIATEARDNRIGGGQPAERNLIAGHSGPGVALFAGAAVNLIQGNFIGTDVTGTQPLGNQGGGIVLDSGANNNLIGGAAGAAGTTGNVGNRIAFNGGGVRLEPQAGSGNGILGNAIFANSGGPGTVGLGIDLAADGPTPNDPLDFDQGPNDLQNYPDLFSASSAATTGTVIQGNLSSASGGTYLLQFFSSPVCNPSSFGEGQTFLGSWTVATDATGNAPFTATLPVLVATGDFITATATDPNNNTSEFSPCIPVNAADLSVFIDASPNPASLNGKLTFNVTVGNQGPSAATNVKIQNTLPATVNFVSAVASQGGCQLINGQVLCNVGTIEAGNTASVAIHVIPTALGHIVNTASVSSDQLDRFLPDNTFAIGLDIFSPRPPIILNQTAALVVAPVGSPVTLFVDATGSPLLQYQWRLNGVNIPGANQSTFTISSLRETSGGIYRVLVYNDFGAVLSNPMQVMPILQDLPMTDKFLDPSQGVVSDQIRAGTSSNVGASFEPREPAHAGQCGGHSMWITWIAQTAGLVTFRTEGSSFDTLLAAYTGTTLDSLVKVASDDDSGPSLTSVIRFYAQANVPYHIAVDGFRGAQGKIVLSWQLDPRAPPPPEIRLDPESRTVGENDPVDFSVIVDPPNATFIFQWFRNDRLITDLPAAQNIFSIPAAARKDVGRYFVRVSDALGNNSRDSKTVSLQLNRTDRLVRSDVMAVDKFGDGLPCFSAPGLMGIGLASPELATVTHGYTGTQIFSTYGSTSEEGEPVHCGIPGGASQWFYYQPLDNGDLTITTDGSDFDTVLAVYTGPGTDFASLVKVDCDNNSGTNGLTSRVSFRATAGTIYYIAVDGVGGVTGIAHLNYFLRLPLSLSAPAMVGSSCKFGVNGTPLVNFTVEGTTNFSSWTALLTTNWPGPTYVFTDTNAPHPPKRFYRASQIAP